MRKNKRLLKLIAPVTLLTMGTIAFSAGTEEASASRKDLQDARSRYREAVATHGTESPEAEAAREALRESRRQYHAENREPGSERPQRRRRAR